MLTIGKLAKATGLTVSTIKFYVEEGLIEPIGRTESKYRMFDDTAVEKISLIRQLKHERFSIKEIKKEIDKFGGM